MIAVACHFVILSSKFSRCRKETICFRFSPPLTVIFKQNFVEDKHLISLIENETSISAVIRFHSLC